MLKRFGQYATIKLVMLGCFVSAVPSLAKAENQTLKVAYATDWVPLTPEGGIRYWKDLIDEFEKENPGVKVEPIKVPGSFADFENKMSLLFRSPDTAPDVAELSNQDVLQWIDSGYLADISSLVASSDTWSGMPDSIKSETTVDGKTYMISHAEDEMALLYDKALFQKAGIPMPWKPKGWQDILAAARKIKDSSPDVWPLWLPTGTAQGAEGFTWGPGNLLVGSSDPTTFDSKENKWVVDSKGLREVIETYRAAASENLLAPSSQLLNSESVATPPAELAKHHIGIALAGNWMSVQWTKDVSAPYYPSAFQEIGYADLPTSNGQAPGVASTLSGVGDVIYANSKQKELAWKFIQLRQTKRFMIEFEIISGSTPPVTNYANDKAWTEFDPFQPSFTNLIPVSTGIPLKSGFNTWALGVLTATEAVVLDPKMSVDDAVVKMTDYVSNQLGPDAIEVKR